MISVKTDKPVGLMFEKGAENIKPSLARSVLKAANYGGAEIAKDAITMFRKGSGQLARSFLPATFIQGRTGIAAGALSDLVYADILNRGGIVMAGRSAKMLAIPLTPKAKTMWPRDWAKSELTLIKSKRGNLILASITRSKSGHGKITPQYVLKKSVEIDARHYIDLAVEKSRPVIAKTIGEDVAHAVVSGMGSVK